MESPTTQKHIYVHAMPTSEEIRNKGEKGTSRDCRRDLEGEKRLDVGGQGMADPPLSRPINTRLRRRFAYRFLVPKKSLNKVFTTSPNRSSSRIP